RPARRGARPGGHAGLFPHPRGAGARADNPDVQARRVMGDERRNGDGLRSAHVSETSGLQRLSIAKGYRLQWEPAQNAHVLLYPEGMVKLNMSAGEILRRCDGARTLSQVITDLEATFNTPGLGPDVEDFVKYAREQGWLEVVA